MDKADFLENIGACDFPLPADIYLDRARQMCFAFHAECVAGDSAGEFTVQLANCYDLIRAGSWPSLAAAARIFRVILSS